MLIRREVLADVALVAELQAAAFGQKLEAALAVALRVGEWAIPEMSLVAEIDGEIVGHAVSSRGVLMLDSSAPPLGSGNSGVGNSGVGNSEVMVPGLGPIGVLPAKQGQGIGSALMHASLAAADALAIPMVVLLGAPGYYGRFGFVASSDVGVGAPTPEWGEFFQVRTLSNYQPALRGNFAYAAPFDDVS